jgi:hypothetical protein
MNSFIKKTDAIKYYNNLKDKTNYKLFQKDKDILHNKIFYVCKSEKIYNNIIINDESHYYEFWTEKIPIKFGIDIDYTIKSNSIKPDELLIKVIEIVICGAKEYYDHEYNIKDIIILENDIGQRIDNANKYSAHIIFKNLTFQNYIVAKDFYLRLNKDYNIADYHVDKSIYNMTCFRLLWCSKMGKHARLIPKELYINNEKSLLPNKDNKLQFFLDSMITYTVSNCKTIRDIKNNTIKNINNDIDDISNINIEKILDDLPLEYCDDYEYWIKIGMILHRYNNDNFELWKNWSKNSPKYTEKDMIKKWKSFETNSNKLSIGTLIKWAKDSGNNDIYKKPILSIEDKINSYPEKPIELDISNDSITTILNQPKLNVDNFVNLLNKKLICIQSEKGTGKTTNLLDALFDSNNTNINSDTKILVVSCRITFSYKILGDLKKYGFSIYHDYKDYHIDAKRIVCQFDSLARLEISDYDIIIIDECESLARYITSSHYIKNPKADLTLEIFQSLVLDAKQIYIMDADLSDRCLNYYKKLIDLDNINDMHILINNYRPCNEYTLKYSQKETWLKKLLDLVLNDKKVVVAMASNSKAKDIYKLLENKLEIVQKNKKILIINRETEENKKKNLLLNVNETWSEYDIIIYTPSVCMGVSFDIDEYFDNIFVYGCSDSLGAQELCQMIHRVRKPKDKYIYITVDNFKEYNKEDDSITYELVENMLCSDYYLTQHELHNNLIKKKIKNEKVEIDENIKYEKKIVYPYKDEAIYDLYVRNAKERIENNFNFTACLFGYAKFKNYKLEYLKSDDISIDKELWNELSELKTERTEKEKEEEINGIINAEDITKEDFIKLIQKQNDYITLEEKYKINRYNIKLCYDIENIELLTYDFIEKFSEKEKMKYYKNLNTIRNSDEQLTDNKLELLKINEKYESNITNCYVNFNNKNKYAYHFYPLEIIKILEFDINDLTKTRSKNINQFMDKIDEAIVFCENKKYEIAFKYKLKITHKKIVDMNPNKKIKYLNNILLNQYGLKIIKDSKTKDDEIYKLDDDKIWEHENIKFKPINIKQKIKKNNYDSSLLDIFDDE